MHHLDITGLKSPEPVLEVRRKLAEMSVGEILEVLASDSSTIHDLPAYCKSAGHQLLLVEDRGGDLFFRIKRRGTIGN